MILNKECDFFLSLSKVYYYNILLYYIIYLMNAWYIVADTYHLTRGNRPSFWHEISQGERDIRDKPVNVQISLTGIHPDLAKEPFSPS